MVDFAHTALGETAPLPIYVDDEGTLCEDAAYKGRHPDRLYEQQRDSTAFWYEACGNARAYLFSDEPLIRMRNTAILPGKDKLEDYCFGRRWVLSTETNNGQADMTGEFMFGIYGYEIKTVSWVGL